MLAYLEISKVFFFKEFAFFTDIIMYRFHD